MMSFDELVCEFGDCVAAQSKAIAEGEARRGNRFAKRYISAVEKLSKAGEE